MTSELSDRQKEIIEVSLALIAENGIQGLTIKNLAKESDFLNRQFIAISKIRLRF